MKTLWVDDLRNPFLNIEGKVPKETLNIEWVINFEQFVQWVKYFGIPDIISFDHDLADFNEDGSENTGMTCARWLIDYCMDTGKEFPRYYVHSANEVGAENITCLVENYKKFKSKISK